MQLRTIAPADRDPLLAMLSRIEQFKPDEVSVAAELIDASIADSVGAGYACIVASEGDEILGYVCFGPTPMTQSTFDLYWIAVSPAAQGRGLGKQLYAACAVETQRQGGRQMRIETSSQELYAATGGFYARLGFEVAGRLSDFYAPGDDLLIFYRSIAE